MKRFLVRLLAALLALGGIGLVLYPNIRRAVAAWQSETVIQTVESRREENFAADTESVPEPEQEDPLYQDMQEYNRKIYEDRQSGLQDAWSYEQPTFRLAEYGVMDDAVGYLSIEAMDLRLPLYLGASRDNLARGAAVLGNTSMPVGGENTNCVIAGHRGWQGIPMFLEIEKLQPGDLVQLDNLWDTLWYEVVEIKIISPDEIDAVKIQDGKDLLTLVTCHPYPHNYQRYVVYCQRVDPESTEETPRETLSPDQEIHRDDSQQTINREKQINRIALFLVLLVVVIIVLWRLIGKKNSGNKH